MSKTQATAAEIKTSALGYAAGTSNFVTSTTGSYVDVTGLSVTVDVPVGANALKITFFAGSSYATAATAVNHAIREGSTTFNQSYINASGTATSVTTVAYVASPTPGSHTYKASVSLGAAATYTVQSNTSMTANTPGQTFILVEVL